MARPFFDGREMALLAACLESGHVAQGPFVARFERGVAEMLGGGHALAVSSCTSALHLAVKALGIGAGDDVVVPALTWVATAHSVEYAGAMAVFADVDPLTFNITAQSVERALTPQTRAIIPVHLFGLPAPMADIMELATQRGVKVIEDAACALGALVHGRHAGSIGDVGAFSFHPRKNITTGEGGMLFTKDTFLAERLAALRNHGASPRKEGSALIDACFDTLSLNFRMNDLQGAVGCAQLEKLPLFLNEKTRLARRYGELLQGLELVLPANFPNMTHTWQSYVVLLPEGGRARRDAVMAYLAEMGVETRAGTQAVHRLDYYAKKYGLRSEDYPMAALCEDTSIALPLYYGMEEAVQDRVAKMLTEALAKR